MNKMKRLEQVLNDIGFVTKASDNVLQIIGIEDEGDIDLEFEKFSHVLRVTIELDDPFFEGGGSLFSGCSLKVHFDDWKLQEPAKIIKLNIASILDENGIFAGMDFEIPKDFNDVVVP